VYNLPDFFEVEGTHKKKFCSLRAVVVRIVDLSEVQAMARRGGKHCGRLRRRGFWAEVHAD